MVVSTKPNVVLLSHQHWLINQLPRAPTMLEHVAVRDLIKETGSMHPVSHTEIDQAMSGAAVLIIGPCRSSMCANAQSAIAEKYAVDLAHDTRIPIALCISESMTLRPPYIERVRGNVLIVATFGLNLQETDTGYLHAWHTDLFAVPKGAGLVHSYFRPEQRRQYFPGNVWEFARALWKLAQP